MKNLVLAVLASVSLLVGSAYSQEYTRTIGPVATGNMNTSISVPAYDPALDLSGAGVLNTVTVQVSLTVDRSYAVRNFSPTAPGLVVFNAAVAGGSYQRVRVMDPFGGFLSTSEIRLTERAFTLDTFGGADSAMFAESFTISTTQINTVNPATFTGNSPLTLPVQLNSIVGIVQYSGECTSRQAHITSAVIKVKYN